MSHEFIGLRPSFSNLRKKFTNCLIWFLGVEILKLWPTLPCNAKQFISTVSIGKSSVETFADYQYQFKLRQDIT
jgi:hypothetical protein